MVSDERFIDQTCEWRNFSEEKDASRIGMSSSIINTKLELDLVTKDKNGFLCKKRRNLSSLSKSDNLFKMFYEAAQVLEMKKIFVEKGIDLLYQCTLSIELSKKKIDSQYLIALIIYNTFKNNGNYKELTDILSLLNLEKNQKTLIKCDLFLRTITKIKNFSYSDNVNTVRLLCNKLDLNVSLTDSAVKVLEKVLSLFHYDNFIPKTIAAASILVTLKLHNQAQPDTIEVSKVSGIENISKLKTIYNKIVKKKNFNSIFQEHETSQCYKEEV
jgi:transcription initiation factor TFIIIB Brf1 subunit/transcription initiation factor TFIIB